MLVMLLTVPSEQTAERKAAVGDVAQQETVVRACR